MNKVILKVIPAMKRVVLCGFFWAAILTGCKHNGGNDGEGEGLLKINEQEPRPITECSIVAGTDGLSDNFLVFQNDGINQMIVAINSSELISRTYTGLDDAIGLTVFFVDGEILSYTDSFANEDDFIMEVKKFDKTYDITIFGNYYTVTAGTEDDRRAFIYKHSYELTYKGTIRAEKEKTLLMEFEKLGAEEGNPLLIGEKVVFSQQILR